MVRILKGIDWVSEMTGKCASFAIIVMILAIGYDITVRYFFATPNYWAYDSVYMIYGAYSLLGAAYCHVKKGHVRMDLFYGRFSTKQKALTEVICYVLIFFPLYTIVTYKCAEHAWWAFTFGERSSASSWRPLTAPFKLSIALGFILFFIQGVAEFIKALTIVIKGESNES